MTAIVRCDWIGVCSKKLYYHTIEMEQMMAHLLSEIRTTQVVMIAGQEDLKDEMSAGQELLEEEMLANIDDNQEEMEARIDASSKKFEVL
jgi:hypothetical protein